MYKTEKIWSVVLSLSVAILFGILENSVVFGILGFCISLNTMILMSLTADNK